MRVLALDTTSRAGSVAILEDSHLVLERVGDATRSLAERLPFEIVDALASIGKGPSDVDLFAVASGPGSFTGLRIGIATIQGLAFVHRVPIAPVSALLALAEGAAVGRAAGSRVGAWIDARRQEVFSALYEVDDRPDQITHLREVEGATVSTPEATLARWRTLGMPVAACGDGLNAYRAAFGTTAEIQPAPPLAALVGRIGLRMSAAGETIGPAGLHPLYVRRPDVEIARENQLARP